MYRRNKRAHLIRHEPTALLRGATYKIVTVDPAGFLSNLELA
jgi:hypothetical protein